MTRLWPAGEALEAWGEGDVPDGFRWRGAAHRVSGVHNRWRIHTRWWLAGPEAAVWREYVKVTTGDGLLCLLYRDLLAGGWFLARVYD